MLLMFPMLPRVSHVFQTCTIFPNDVEYFPIFPNVKTGSDRIIFPFGLYYVKKTLEVGFITFHHNKMWQTFSILWQKKSQKERVESIIYPIWICLWISTHYNLPFVIGTLGSLKKSPQPLMNTLVTTTLHPQTAASASAVVVTVEQPQTTSKQGFNVVQQNQTPVLQLMTHLPQQAPQVIEDDNTPVKGMFLGFAISWITVAKTHPFICQRPFLNE